MKHVLLRTQCCLPPRLYWRHNSKYCITVNSIQPRQIEQLQVPGSFPLATKFVIQMGTLKVPVVNDRAISNMTGIDNIQVQDASKKEESACFIEMT